MKEKVIANALVSVLEESRWVGYCLAKAYLMVLDGQDSDATARYLYDKGAFSLTKARELTPRLKDTGFLSLIKNRTKTGSAENPITKLFPAAITEQRFLMEIDSLREVRLSVDYEDDRHSGHTLVDFTLIENNLRLPINVKNAGTRFKNALQLVGIEPNNCVPIPVYKAYDAIEKEPNLLYAISIDYGLINLIGRYLIPELSKDETITWKILNEKTGAKIRDAEDKFIYTMTSKHWECIAENLSKSPFRLISARKAIRILQKQPRRTPGIGLRAWGTGASAEVNVHISVAEETKPWEEIFDRISGKGLEDIIGAINRKRTEIVYDPEI